MNLTSWIRRQQPETRAAANYTDAWVQQLIRGADGSGDANVEASGALQAVITDGCARVYGLLRSPGCRSSSQLR